MLDFSGKYDLACNYFNFLPQVTCKKAEARQGKVYVGKLPPGEALSKEDLQAHFEQFGSVVEVVRPVDKMKNNEPKTFAFTSFYWDIRACPNFIRGCHVF